MIYPSPIGDLYINADKNGLTELSFYDGKPKDEADGSYAQEVKCWLDIYFSGEEPAFAPKTSLCGTPFQLDVWELINKIPYGKVSSYGEIAQILAKRRGIKKMSAQAVGQAVGKNPVAIIVPCHRVIGTDLSMTGYGGGLERKKFLLSLEKADLSRIYKLE